MKTISFLLVLLISISVFSCKFQKKTGAACDEEVTHPFIQDSVANKVASVMSDWFDFYNININEFKLIQTTNIDIESHEDDAVTYLRKYTADDSLFLPEIRDYSPDQRYHLNLLEATDVKKGSDQKWHLLGNNTDTQYIFLFDKEESALFLAAIHDVNNFSDAAFWLDNTIFVISGKRFLGKNNNRYYFDIYNLTDRVKDRYSFKDSLLVDDHKSYFKEVNLKKRGILVK